MMIVITENQKNELIQHVANFVGMASIRLPDDVMARLQEMRDNETKPSAITLYDIMIGNQKRAVEVKRPTCQDTGIVHLYVRAGAFSPYLNVLTDVINQAVVKATKETPLRLNAVETFDEYNTGTNVGTGVPYIEWTIVPDSDKIEMDVYFAGGGCSLPGKSAVLMPAKGYEGIVDFVLDIVTDRGVNACPPLAIGVGIGGCITTATHLSKKALLRKVGSHNPNPKVAEFEQILTDAINKIGIGPQGLGGSESLLGLNVETICRHPATLAVSVSTGCWAHRRATLAIDKDGNCDMITHKGAVI